LRVVRIAGLDLLCLIFSRFLLFVYDFVQRRNQKEKDEACFPISLNAEMGFFCMDREWSRQIEEKFELIHVEFKISWLIQMTSILDS
jgi:hypothetical protein